MTAKLLPALCSLAIVAGLQAQPYKRFEYVQPKMGTTFQLVLYAGVKEEADSAAAAAFRRIDELNAIFSDYHEDSEVSRLSATAGTGKRVAVSGELWEVLTFARQLSRESRGAFDVSIGPLSKLWRRAFRQQEFPDPERIEAAVHLVDYRQIRLYPGRQAVRLKRAGMRLDLGGIAKGYTVDAVYDLLRHRGIDRALVDGGGDIYAGEAPPGESGWAIQWQDEHGATQALTLRRRAIATSGATYKYLEWEGQRYSHIIDPRTGLGVTGAAIINVVAGNCMAADALASALSVLTPPQRAAVLEYYPGAALLE